MNVAESPFPVVTTVTFGAKVVGLVIEAVPDVSDVRNADVAPPRTWADTSFLNGIVHNGERLVFLLLVGCLVENSTGTAALAS